MSEDTKTCPYCAEEIKPAAVVCKHCGNSLTGDPSAPPTPAAEKKKPKLGLWGILIMFIAAPLACMLTGAGDTGMVIGIIVGIIGAGLLIYAIATGNVKMFG